LLRDEELSDHLRKGHTLLFKGLGNEWQQIERQVERLGFGETYFVSQLEGHESSTKLSPAVVTTDHSGSSLKPYSQLGVQILT
jgi:hypothetical protein